MSIDRNAADPNRLRRNQQRARAGDLTGDIKVTSPLSNSGSKLGLTLATNGGLQNATGLAVKLNAAGALSVGASGLAAAVDGTSVQIVTNALAVKLNAAGAITGTSGLAVAVDGTTVEINTNALRVKDGGIATSKLAANAVTPAKLALATSGGLADNGSGALLVLGSRTVTADPTPTDGDQWYNSTEKKFKSQSGGFVGRRSQLVFAAVASSTAVKNTTTLTAVSGFQWAPPANYLTAGKSVRVKLGGAYTATGTSPLLTIDLFSNGTSGGIDGVAINLGTNTSGRFHAEFVCTIRSVGVSGVVTPTGFLAIEAAGVNAFQTFGQGSGVAIDTTVALNWSAVVQWSAASNSNAVTLHYMTVEVLE